MLDPGGSATLRDKLLAEVDGLSSTDAATWAHQIMAAKNSLAAADARRVEEAFAAKLTTLGNDEAEVINAPISTSGSDQPGLPQNLRPAEPSEVSVANRVDKSLLTLPEPRRFRDKTHIKFVAKQACLICGRNPADAHHLRFAQHPALGRKVSDEFIVPLCRGHHREVHRCGDETVMVERSRNRADRRRPSAVAGNASVADNSEQNGIDGANFRRHVETDPSKAKLVRPVSRRDPNYETKPITSIPQI